jgi:hypothetical protein
MVGLMDDLLSAGDAADTRARRPRRTKDAITNFIISIGG